MDFNKNQKIRFYISCIFIFILLIVAHTTSKGFHLGIPIILIGEGLRFWTQGHLSKKIQIITGGYDAYIRNPLYLANYLIGFGFMMVLSSWGFVVLYTIGFFWFYAEPFIPNDKLTLQSFDWHLTIKNDEHITFFVIILTLIGLYLRQEWIQEGKDLYHLFLRFFACTLIAFLAYAIGQKKYASVNDERS